MKLWKVVRATVKRFMMMNSGLYIWVSSNEKKYLKKGAQRKINEETVCNTTGLAHAKPC
jgi:hypothetical protein